MEESGTKSYEDDFVKLTLRAPSERHGIDTKLLKEKENWKDIKDKFATLYHSKPVGVKLANDKAKGVEVQPEALEELLKTMTEETPDE